MESHRILAYILFILFTVVLPALIIGAAVLIARAFTTATPGLRQVGLRSAFGVAGLAVVDLLLLKALTWLGLSYGPVALTLFAVVSVRGIIYILWASLLLRSAKDRIGLGGVLPLWGCNVLLTLLLIYSFYIEPFNLQVSHIQIPITGQKLSRPVRIVQLSDIHVERTTPRERALVSLVQAQNPDLIVMTGDYLNVSFLDDPTAMRDARDLMAKLHAPYGVYAVDGSVDNEARMHALFTGLDITVLDDTWAPVKTPGGTISLIGVNTVHQARDVAMLSSLTRGLPGNTYHVLLYHTPDLIREAARDQVDLYLAGHTHGGQVRLPFYGAIITYSMYEKEFEMGRYQMGPTTLYVNRGIGMEGSLAPRARFLAAPEVTVFDLVPIP